MRLAQQPPQSGPSRDSIKGVGSRLENWLAKTSDQLVNDIFEEFLTSAAMLDRVGFAHRMFFERCEAFLARFDCGANAGVPGRVAIFEHLCQPAVRSNRRGDFQAAGEGVHAADVGVEQVDRLEAFAADLGVEVDAARGEAAHI